MRRISAALLLAACLTLAGCSGSSSDDKPAPTPTTSATPAASTEKPLADQIAACTDAIAAGSDEGEGAPECADLSSDDYFKALQDANQRGRDALQSAIDSASAAAR
ncbi:MULTISPECIES: hypothetical protein [Streptomyces]|uniref:Secreted protein n=2 Tax=Streptomyces TaxID=1883 RepID=A0ABV9J828_9ACTN